MKSEELIQSLTHELIPVRRLARSDVRAAAWVGTALICVFAGAILLGIRSDLASKLLEPAYLTEAAALLAVCALSAWSAFRSSIPGLYEHAGVRVAPLLAVFGWLALLSTRQIFRPEDSLLSALLSSGVPCVARMAWLTTLPALTLLLMLRRAAALERGWTGLWSLLAASSLAMLGTQAVCAKDSAAHVIVWHALPVLLTAVLGVCLGSLLLQRK